MWKCSSALKTITKARRVNDRRSRSNTLFQPSKTPRSAKNCLFWGFNIARILISEGMHATNWFGLNTRYSAQIHIWAYNFLKCLPRHYRYKSGGWNICHRHTFYPGRMHTIIPLSVDALNFNKFTMGLLFITLTIYNYINNYKILLAHFIGYAD